MRTLVDIATLLGLAVAVGQLIRVGRLSRATYGAVRATTEQFAEYNILLLIPELGRIEAECELAVAKPDEDAVRRLLQAWRDTGGELRGFLSRHGEAADDFRVALQRSLAQATRAKSKLNGGEALGDAARAVMDAMTRTCEAGRTFGATLRIDVHIEPPPRTVVQWIQDTVAARKSPGRQVDGR